MPHDLLMFRYDTSTNKLSKYASNFILVLIQCNLRDCDTSNCVDWIGLYECVLCKRVLSLTSAI